MSITYRASMPVLFAIAGFSAGTATAQPDNDVVINAAGVTIRCQLFGPCFPNQFRNSQNNPLPAGTPQFILPASGYRYVLDGVVATSGLLGTAIPNGSTLGEAFDAITPGGSRVLTGYSRNFSGGLPNPSNQVFFQRYAGSFGGIDMGLSLEVSISNGGVGQFAIRDINIPLGILAGSMEITSGSATIETWVPSTPQESEWHFDGSLDTVNGSARAAIRYLDDPAFGTILGGIDSPETPDPTTPTGVTAQQSQFTTTNALGIAGPGGENATVYVTSPARNLATGLSKDRRGIGLALAPNLRPEYPGQFFGQWTMVWDLYIPASSWYADFPANTTPRQFPVALLEDNFNNDSSADIFIRNHPTLGPTVGYNASNFSQYIPIPIAPDSWFRLAIACDFFTKSASRVYINGNFIGTIEADWLYCGVDVNAPAYGDGEPVHPADWAAWGQFPNHWARSSGSVNGTPTPIASTLCLFSDLQGGRSETVYLANLNFIDTVRTDAEIAQLGGPDAAGIVFTGTVCAADLNGDGTLDFFDVQAFLQAFAAQNQVADINNDNVYDFFDVQAFLQAFSAGCP